MNRNFEIGKIYASSKTLFGKSDLMYEYCGYNDNLKMHEFRIVSPEFGRMELHMSGNIKNITDSGIQVQYVKFYDDNFVMSVAELSSIIEFGSLFFHNDLTELRNKWREFYKIYKSRQKQQKA